MSSTVLVVGATGNLGGRVAGALLAEGKRVRALAREGSDASRLETQGIEIVRGDLLDPASLDRALSGVDALVTTAIGYSRRRKGDSLKSVDDLGNRNLIDAARRANLGRFVFTSILNCDKAPRIPHFWAKKLIEDYLEASGIPFVALRPGMFVGAYDFWSNNLRKGRMLALGSSAARWTHIHVDDVARYLALSVDEPRAVGQRIDLGMDRPISTKDIAGVFSKILNREITVRAVPWWLLNGFFKLGGLLSPTAGDFGGMFEYFLTGQSVADLRLQTELFGFVPTVEESLRRVAVESRLVAEAR